MKIGLLVGREESFPRAFIEAVRALGRNDLDAEMVQFGGTRMDDLGSYDVIIDRISHEVPYYRLALKQAALNGVRIINNPFWCSADDKFFGYSLAARIGLAIPRTILLPNKSYIADIKPESLRNLAYPIDWQGHVDWVGLPAFLKPACGGGWKHVYKVDSVEEMLFRYDQTDLETMVLQSAVHFDRYVRCFCFGRSEVIVCHYDPGERRYLPLESDYLEPDLEARIRRDTVAICDALGYDCNTVEFAIEDGVPWAIDFTNQAPDMEYWSITPEYFDRVVQGMVRLAVRLADEGRARVSGARFYRFLGGVDEPAVPTGGSKARRAGKRKVAAGPGDEAPRKKGGSKGGASARKPARRKKA